MVWVVEMTTHEPEPTAEDIKAVKIELAENAAMKELTDEAARKAREDVLYEFKWVRPMCFGSHEAICDTRCAWLIRKRCVKSLRQQDKGGKA